MKILFTLFILFFSSSVWAEDISDFEIEGISIGDSLLNYLSERNIKSELNRTQHLYIYLSDNSKFGEVYKFDDFKKYYFISFFVKPDDNQYIIQSIRGTMPHEPNMKQCINQMEKVSEEFSILFKSSKETKKSFNHPIDQTGRSKISSIDYVFKSGNEIRIACIDFEESLRVENNWIDGLDISIYTKEIGDWLKNY